MPQLDLLPTNIKQITTQLLDEDQTVVIQFGNLLLLMPIFRWDEVRGVFVEATGYYDLCMSEDGLKYYLTSRMAGTNLFAWRYVSTFFPASALKDQTVKHGRR